MKILFATWGEPKSWSKVNYRFKDVSEQACSTLGLIKKVIQPDKTIILVTDTLAAKEKEINANCGDKRKLKFMEEYSYKGVINFVKTYIKETLKDFNTSADEIWVLPSAGYFPNIAVKGELSDIRYFLFLKFFKHFEIFLNKDSNEDIEVFLDITHGQNFLPTFTFEVLKNILEVLVFFVSKRTSVKLTVFNSDPFIPYGISSETILEIHKVMEFKIAPKPYMYYSNRVNFLSSVSKGINLKDVLKPIHNEKDKIPLRLTTKVPAFFGAIYNGLPLVTFYTYIEPEYISNLLNTVIDIYQKYIDIKIESDENGKFILERKLKLRPEVEIFAIYGMFLKGLKHIFPGISSLAATNIGKENVKIPLKALKEITDKFIGFSEKNKILIEKEITDIEYSLKDKGDFDWQLYSEILNTEKNSVLDEKNSEENETTLSSLGNERRNFLAHAGLSRKAIYVKKEKGNIFVRYALDKKDINIWEWASTGLINIS